MATATPTDRKPDAVLYHQTFKRGTSQTDRLRHIQVMLGPRLPGTNHTELGPQHGGRVYSREIGGGWYLASNSPHDAPYFGRDHDHAGMPRYRWEDQPDGTRHGFLLTPAETEQAAHAEAPDDRDARLEALEKYKAMREAHDRKLLRWRDLAAVKTCERTAEQTAEMQALYAEIFTDSASQEF